MLVIAVYFYHPISSWEERLSFLVMSWPISASQSHRVPEFDLTQSCQVTVSLWVSG